MELHLGFMSTKELAAWLGISASWFRNSKAKQLDKIDDYCRYEPVYGGIKVLEIFGPTTYSSDYCKHIDAKILDAVGFRERGENYNTYMNVSRITHLSPYIATKRLKKLFGSPEEPGYVGYRGKAKYCVEEYDERRQRCYYRELTKEEREYMRELISAIPELNEEMALALDAIMRPDPDAASAEPMQRAKIAYDNWYKQVLKPLMMKIGKSVKRATLF